MKVCYFSTYYFKDYVRSNVLIEGLKENGVEVIKCVESGKNPLRYLRALMRFKKIEKDADVIIVGFLGHEILPFVRLLTKKPLVFDAFISIYESLCFDMKIIRPDSFLGKIVFWFEKKCIEWPQKILLDTNEQIKYFTSTFGTDGKKFHRLFVGADKIFFPQNKNNSGKFLVLWYGSYIPLHGVEYIVRAALKLKDYPNIRFKLIGDGRTFEAAKKISESNRLENIEFAKRVEYELLPQEIANCNVFLGGHFGTSHKSKSVISGKTFQAMAMKAPLIVGNNPATKELFSDKKNCLMVDHGSGEKIAQAVLLLKNDKALSDKIKKNAYRLFLKTAAPKVIGKELKKILEGLHEPASV